MAINYIEYSPHVLRGQATLNVPRTHKTLTYKGDDEVEAHISRGLPLYETSIVEPRGENANGNIIMRGECTSACAYLRDNNIQVDLVYIDPPFASGADYAKKIYLRRNPKVAEAIAKAKAQAELDNEDMRVFEAKMYGDIWEKEKYLNWMYENLLAIKSVMSPTASIYVHLDWHIGHYVKILLDEIFGEACFINEIVWCYNGPGSPGMEQYNRKHDTIFWYSMSPSEHVFNDAEIRVAHNAKTLENFKRGLDGSGFISDNYELNQKGKIPEDWWQFAVASRYPVDGIKRVQYATEKPYPLIERIVKGSSNAGMIVADFFGGSGVTATAAHLTGRRFIHVDINENSIITTRDRLVKANAEFVRMEIKDGVSLFRNPAQTNDILPKLISGLVPDRTLSSYWNGVINNSSYGKIPVHLPNFTTGSIERVFSKASAHKLCYEQLSALPTDVKRCIVYYVDIDDIESIKQYIVDNTKDRLVDVELLDVKILLDHLVAPDDAEFSLKEVQDDLLTTWRLEVISFTSDRVKRKIDEYNKKYAFDDKKPQILLSDEGLEAIEWISLDSTTGDINAPWISQTEILIEPDSYISRNGKKTSEFWDGSISLDDKPLRVKIRNICGDESVFALN